MKKTFEILRNNNGFTILELLMVLAIMGIIATIAVPKLLTVQSSAKRRADFATALSIVEAVKMYEMTEGEKFLSVPQDTTSLVSAVELEDYIDTAVKSQTSGGDFTITLNDEKKYVVSWGLDDFYVEGTPVNSASKKTAK